MKMPKKPTAKKSGLTVGARIIEGLEQALAWSKGEQSTARVNLVSVPDIDIRELRRGMGLSQSQFAVKFGLPPATGSKAAPASGSPAPPSIRGRRRRAGQGELISMLTG